MSLSVNKRWSVPIAFANIYIIWGVTFIAITFGIKGFPPFILSGIRFLAAGLILFGYLRAKGEKANSFVNWKKNALTGILILTGGTGVVGWAEQYVSASETSIAIAAGPFWFIAIDRKNWRNYFSDKWTVIGLIIGFTGLLLFLGGSVNDLHSSSNVSISLRISAFIALTLSSIAWVLGSLYSKNNPSSHSTFLNISQQLISAGVFSFIIAFFSKEWNDFSISKVPISAWSGLLFLIFFGSIITYLSYIWLLSFKSAAVVSTHTYINPIVTVFAGWIISGERINGGQFVGLFIILGGVLLTNLAKYIKVTDKSKERINLILKPIKRVIYPLKLKGYRL